MAFDFRYRQERTGRGWGEGIKQEMERVNRPLSANHLKIYHHPIFLVYPSHVNILVSEVC